MKNDYVVVKGNVFIHIKSGNSYKVKDRATIKINGVWENCVIYSPIEEYNKQYTYVRLLSDFAKKFIKVEYR